MKSVRGIVDDDGDDDDGDDDDDATAAGAKAAARIASDTGRGQGRPQHATQPFVALAL